MYGVTVGGYGVGTLVAGQFTRHLGLKGMIIFGGLVMTISGEIMVILPLLGYFNIWTVILPFLASPSVLGSSFPTAKLAVSRHTLRWRALQRRC